MSAAPVTRKDVEIALEQARHQWTVVIHTAVEVGSQDDFVRRLRAIEHNIEGTIRIFEQSMVKQGGE
jgi:nucleoside-diphosphate-sugar epimerase